MLMERILLTHLRAPGDIVCMTACVRDLALTYPGKYEIHVSTSHQSIWDNNPYVASVNEASLQYPIRRHLVSCRHGLETADNVKLHYITAFHHNLETELGIQLPVRLPKGDLHLTEFERSTPLLDGPYWLLIAGGKTDMTTKIWSRAKFQELVYKLRDHGIECVQDGASGLGHIQPVLDGVTSFVGKTDLREAMRLIYHSQGVICPVTFAMHVAAAFDKRCIVIAGGREPWWWEAYMNSSIRQFGQTCAPVRVPHRYLHTIGRLDCCAASGCWKTKVVAGPTIESATACTYPMSDEHGQHIPRCLDLISTDAVVDAVLEYEQRKGEQLQTVGLSLDTSPGNQ
jgi:ADP-heptose:LPS heptosyltransferase